MSTAWDRDEVAQTVDEYRETMRRARLGEASFDAVLAYYTDDAVYEEPNTGRTTGPDAIVELFRANAATIPGVLFLPTWTVIDGNRVVYEWITTLPQPRSDGSAIQGAPGLSVLLYAGNGAFSEHADVYDRGRLVEFFTEAATNEQSLRA